MPADRERRATTGTRASRDERRTAAGAATTAALSTLAAGALRRPRRSRPSAEAREEIDALNVYPVPDGDTGTNLFLTFEAAHEALHESLRRRAARTTAELPRLAAAYARGAAARRPGQLRRHHVASCVGALLRPDRRRPRPDERSGRGARRGAAREAADGRLRRGRPPGRGHDPHAWPGPPRSGGRGRRRPRRAAPATSSQRRAAAAAREALARTPEQLAVLARRRGGRRRRARALPRARRRRGGVHGPARAVAGRPRPARRHPGRQPPATGGDLTADGPGLRGDVPPRRRRRRRPGAAGRARSRSATRSSSWAASGCGTSTSTSTTSAPRSRPGSRRAGRTGSGSPTSPSRWRPSAAAAPAPAAERRRPRGRRGRRRAGLAALVRRGRRAPSCEAAPRPRARPPASCSRRSARTGAGRGRRCCPTTATSSRRPRRPPGLAEQDEASGSRSSRPGPGAGPGGARRPRPRPRPSTQDLVAMTAAARHTRYGRGHGRRPAGDHDAPARASRATCSAWSRATSRSSASDLVDGRRRGRSTGCSAAAASWSPWSPARRRGARPPCAAHVGSRPPDRRRARLRRRPGALPAAVRGRVMARRPRRTPLATGASAAGRPSATLLTRSSGSRRSATCSRHYPRRYLDLDEVSPVDDLVEGELRHAWSPRSLERRSTPTRTGAPDARRTAPRCRLSRRPRQIWMTFFDRHARRRASGVDSSCGRAAACMLVGQVRAATRYQRDRWELTHPEVDATLDGRPTDAAARSTR